MLPVLMVVCHEESIWTLEEATKALLRVANDQLGLDLTEWVSDWYWDGAPEV